LIQGDRSGVDSRTSGSSMRVGPLGLYYYDNYSKLKEITIETTRLTHNNNDAVAAALSVAFFVAESVNEVKPEIAVQNCSKFIEDISTEFSERILSINDLKSANEAYDIFKTGLDSMECAPSAIASFVKTNGFKEGMIACVNAGGDTDSMGSMYGAIAGAYYGVEDIPDIWISGIQNKNMLFKLSNNLYALKFGY